MRKACITAASIFAASAAFAETINFDSDSPGALPAGWEQGVTGKGAPRWAVKADASAPSKPNVLEQSGSGTFPWCVKDASLADGWLEGCFVECPLHAAQFDLRTGVPACLPAKDPVRTHRVVVTDGVLYVDAPVPAVP